MPKKTKPVKDKKESKTDSEKIKLKQVVMPEEKSREESGLEEEIIESEEIIDSKQFQRFLTSSGSPILESVGGSQAQRVRFWQPAGLGGESDSDLNGGEDPFKYSAASATQQEIKYIQSSATMRLNPEQVDFREIGRKEFQPSQEVFHTGFSEMRQMNMATSNVEKYVNVNHVDAHKVGRDDQSKKEDRKYEFKQSGR